MPILVATGNNIGVAIKINGAISITMPRSNKITRIISIVMASFGEKLIIVSDTIAGTFNKASNQPNADEAPIRNKTIANVLKVRCKITPILEIRSEEHTSELQSRGHLVCRLLLENK